MVLTDPELDTLLVAVTVTVGVPVAVDVGVTVVDTEGLEMAMFHFAARYASTVSR